MINIPTGTVTFLFSDVEGSTKLAQDFPETLPSALEKHHSIMQNAVESNNGFVFEIVGDAFCCAFEKADDAIKAAVDAQINLANEKWDNAVIKIRIGIHSGSAEWNGQRYMGYITLARTARVMSAAYGEQIIISNNTYELCKYTFAEVKEKDISFRDLGERRLKDVIQPLRLFQILCPGLRKEFPSLKTLDARPNNLPVQLTNFIGREKEMAQLKKLLLNTKLLTLIGQGGTGKTRLSMQVAADMIDEFTNGVWIVELASLFDPVLIPQTMARSLRISEQPNQETEYTLVDYLKDKEILVILDNCEHLIDACAQITEKLLQGCQKLKIIATSREALRCSGETIHKVLSLAHPEPNQTNTPLELSQFEAVRLFIERAITVNPNFRVNNENAPALAQICYQLDGIPLAIELAAVRIKVLSVTKICEKLNDRFRLLTGGKRTALPRQQTLKALIDWSYDLLSDKEKILWRRLSAFNGNWSLNAAEEICTDELLDGDDVFELINGLVEKSIILFIENSGRYKMLETMKQYGEERLNENGETKKFKTKHLVYYLNLCEGAIPELSGPNAKTWLDRFEEEYTNIQTALEWSIDDNLKEEGNRLAGAMYKFWDIRGYFSEASNWFERLLQNNEGVSPVAFANSKRLAGLFANKQGKYGIAIKLVEEALEIFRKIKDKIGISKCLSLLGLIEFYLDKYESSKKFLNECIQIKRELGDKTGICSVVNILGVVAVSEGDFSKAEIYFNECLEIAREQKDDRYLGIVLSNFGLIYLNYGDYEKAKTFFEDGYEADCKLGNKSGITISLINLGVIELHNEDYNKAKKLFEEALSLSIEIGERAIYPLNGLGQTYLEEGDTDNAKKYFEECLILQKGFTEIKTLAESLTGIAEIRFNKGEYEVAARLAGAVKAQYESTNAYINDNVNLKLDFVMKSVAAHIGDERAIEEFEKGKTLSADDAIELATEDQLS